MKAPGVGTGFGALGEYFHVNDADANMAKIPDNVPDEVAVYCADMGAFEVVDKKLEEVVKVLIKVLRGATGA